MRILTIHNFYKQAGGEDTVFHAEAALLEQYGHQVEKLTFSNKEVNSLPEKLKAAVGVVYNAGSAKIVEQRIKAFGPDVIHVHNFFPLLSPAVFYVAHRLRIPVVMTLHNYRLVCPSALLYYKGKIQTENLHKTFPLGAIRDKVYRDSAVQTASVVLTTGIHKVLRTWERKVDKFIALTPGAARLFKDSSLKLRPEQLAVKPNFTEDLGIGTNQREEYMLYVGRLTPEKGIETLLRAHAEQPFPLKIVGDGPLRALVEAHAAQNPTLEYLGYLKRDDALELIKSAKGLIFSSEWLETFGMTIIEAFSTGTPVVAAKIGGAEQLVEHGINGLHYTPGNAAELAEKVQKLLTEPQLAADLGRAARQTYEDRYTPEVNYHQLVAIYQEAIAAKKMPIPEKEVAQLQ
ncbi:glycosyltransferase family 4 protein [Pontibacter ramchanderi]|uniref:Glycosyltransferase involved in cell wall biosynthesis n=1 Tax=Pontibacter ramchanderi TaxID=1179743 RepID=A0A2N3V3G1_9BACT|nr:glycosyltransferase family 4 protein [Pontibacter ramchanderi]PKV76164.1 glycosyltransferase involved in cell wall biosynthesis [Pontibacter ramchanderi]